MTPWTAARQASPSFTMNRITQIFWFPSACKCYDYRRLWSVKYMMKPSWWISGKDAIQETQVRSLSPEDALEKEMATHSSILAWRIPRTEEPGGLQFIGLQRGGHDGSNLACRQTSVSCHHIATTNIHSLTTNTLWLKNGSASLSLQ